jgi:hypothetical protein
MRIPLTLGPERREAIPGCQGLYVRINDDLRKCVVFFGFEDNSRGKGGINCVGTGFLVAYDEVGFLVTAKHLAHSLGNNPFLVRLNRKDGTSENTLADGVHWYEHPDPTVDVAVMHISVGGGPGSDYEVLYAPQDMLVTDAMIAHPQLGILGVGDITYTIGLFRLMSGESRNLPVVHLGSVAMMPKDEKIPVRDWRNPKNTLKVEGYLVETQAMQGLSGSPTFIRPTTSVSLAPPNVLIDPRSASEEDFSAAVPMRKLFLLGLWAASWDAPPDEVLSVQAGKQNRVPVGMGVVVPAQKIIETLEQQEVKDLRKKIKEMRAAHFAETAAASTDSAIPTANPSVELRGSDEGAGPDANPNHQADFTRLVDVAARKRPQDD